MQHYKVVTALKMTEINNLTFIMTPLLWFFSVLWSPSFMFYTQGLGCAWRQNILEASVTSPGGGF